MSARPGIAGGFVARVARSAVAVAIAAALVGGVAVPAARAGTVVVHQLGEQDFAAGQGPVPIAQVKAVGANEAYPFDGTVFGDDRDKRFGKVSFGFAFDPPPAGGAGGVPAADGTLTLGLVGLDSPPGSEATVRLFLNGVEQPNDAFAGASSPLYKSSASVVTVPVPAALLADGTLTVAVKAFRASPGYAGNAIEADFAALAVPSLDLPTPPPTNGPGGATGGNVPGTGGTGGTGGTPPGGNTPGGGGGSGGGTSDPGGTPTPGGSGSGGGGTPGGGDHGGGNNNSGGGTGGGGTVQPPQSVPLPPGVYTGAAGLLAAWFLRRKV